MSDEQHRMHVASTGLVGTAGKFLDAHGLTLRADNEALSDTLTLCAGGRRVIEDTELRESV